jgi:ABC-type multidrug transport system ATPase subunit
LENIGKRFGREWIFRGIHHIFEKNSATVILGANGSGKSTLLQIIAGNLMLGEGTVRYELDGKEIPQDKVYGGISYASPYLELMEDFTLEESILFQSKFRKWRGGMNNADVLQLSGLAAQKDKQLRNFSSGMKMRTKLTLAVLSDSSLLLLDEPCSNLDHASCEWYNELVSKNASGRTIVVCSNEVKEEYGFCSGELRMDNFKIKVNG